ncbi:hypothetical protein [Serinibacter salmoneus]|uniref:Cell division protein FtsL n=1 Tax=Serinibacter salmoneus TaxID=556530 RepID=A0A2A9D0L7_9MICO|nr:hypothetical protein [Serinibacter salmoneus]PFG19380.1 hypothetical protein ATL40_0940 [Serinibacter salmoneus]
MSVAPLRTAAPRPTVRRRPPLQVVRGAKHEGSRAPFLGLCAAILIAALLGALAINTVMAATSHAMSAKQAQVTELTAEVDALRSELELVRAPASVMARAERLGLTPSEGIQYVRLADGRVVGGE